MPRTLVPATLVGMTLVAALAHADPLRSSYATGDGRAGTVIIACPSKDGSFSAAPCAMNQPGAVSYAAPASAAITTGNVPITIFAPGTVATGCDIINTGSAVIYLDFTGPAIAGSPTSIPLQPGQAFHCPYPPAGAVSAVAAQPQSFVAIRY